MIGVLAMAAAAVAQPPQAVLTIGPSHRLVEGVASDGKTIWVSSILDRQVLACRATCRSLATLPEPLHPFAIAWDSLRERLWVAADCPPGVPAIKACDRGALLALDRQGRIQTRIAPYVGEFHPGDVSASRGRVFVSDSQNGMVFRLTKNERGIMAVVLPDTGKSAQGTALDESGEHWSVKRRGLAYVISHPGHCAFSLYTAEAIRGGWWAGLAVPVLRGRSVRLHPGQRTPAAGVGRRSRTSPGTGHGRVLRNGRSDRLRPALHADLLRRLPRHWRSDRQSPPPPS